MLNANHESQASFDNVLVLCAHDVCMFVAMIDNNYTLATLECKTKLAYRSNKLVLRPEITRAHFERT